MNQGEVFEKVFHRIIWNFRKYFLSLRHKNTNNMEEIKHPIIEEENIGMCCESSVALDYDDADDFVLPILGPSTLGEAIADIEESEKEFDAGKCLPWEDVMSEMKERYHLYAY